MPFFSWNDLVPVNALQFLFCVYYDQIESHSAFSKGLIVQTFNMGHSGSITLYETACFGPLRKYLLCRRCSLAVRVFRQN